MAALTTLIIIAEYAALMVASMALSYVVSSLIQPEGLKGTTQTDPGVRSQVPPDTTTSVPVVYGSAYLGGRFVDACLRATDQKVMYYVQAISCIGVNGNFKFDTTKMYYGDRLITFAEDVPNKVYSLTDGAGNVDTTIDTMLYISLYTSDENGNITAHNVPDNLMPWEYQAGSDATSVLMGEYSGLPTEQQWTATGRRMNGLAFAVVRLSYSREAGTTSLQPLTYHCQQYFGAENNVRPGEVLYDYLTNPIYGGAVDPDFIDTASLQALNDYSDEVIPFTTYSGTSAAQPRYRINGVIDAGKNVLKNIDDIMSACDSWLRYEASTGKWSVTINKAETPVMELTDKNIIGSINVGTVDLAQTVNVVEAKFPDSTNRDQYNYVTEAVPSALLYPNEPVNKQTLTYELVNNSVQALYLANRVLEQGREDLTVTINTTYEGIQLSAGDVVAVTNSAYGWNQKLFRCMQVQESVTSDMSLGAQLQLIEYNAQVYDNFDITQFTPAGNTNNPSAGYFSPLTPPAVVDSFPYDKVPTFDVNCAIPLSGRTTAVTLFYTTATTPTTEDWITYGTQVKTNSQSYAPAEIVTFLDLSLPAATYLFAYKVTNDLYASVLSPLSDPFIWAPDPSGYLSFVGSFVPATLQVPYDGSTATFTNVTCRLYGSNGLGAVDFVPAQTDADVAFIENTWRIGASDVTGYASITETDVTIANPTDGGSYAQFPAPSAMAANPASMLVPIRYKDTTGAVHQMAPSAIQLVYAQQGTTGKKTATVNLFQWSTSVPSNPSGTSLYTWATGQNTSYTGGGGWTTTAPSNPGTPSIMLYTATKQIIADNADATTTVSWTSGYTILAVTQNGADGINGLQAAQPTVYQWAASIPTGPTGTSTYTWSSNTFTPIPSGWSATAGTSPSPGYTLWGAQVNLLETAGVSTTSINWTTATITARGYAGSNGSTGTTGASARICYTKTTLSSLSSTPATITTSGSTSFPPNGSWGTGTVWQATPPSITAGESVYQSDGIYSPTTGNTVWNVPYLSALKVGSLSAITTNTGSLSVTGTMQANTAAISGTTMTGSGMVVYNTGQFAIGNSTTNITYNGTAINMNGDVVITGNLKNNAATIASGEVIANTSSIYVTTYFTIGGLGATETVTVFISVGLVAGANCNMATYVGATQLSSDSYIAGQLSYIGTKITLGNGSYSASLSTDLSGSGDRRLSIQVIVSKR